MEARSYMFRRRRVWFYPCLRMNVAHLKPKTIIKGFLYSRPMVGGKSYFIDFGLFKISIGAKQMTWEEWLKLNPTYEGTLHDNSHRKIVAGNFNYRKE